MASTSRLFYFFVLLLFAAAASAARHSVKLQNHTLDAECRSSGSLRGSGGHHCSECCRAGKTYPQYQCSPPLKKKTPATLTLNDFQKGGDGGGPSECDKKYHNNTEHVVALSTGWFAKKSRCGKSITIYANGRSATAMVVDECDSVQGCDLKHAFQPPCSNNIVDASSSVWRALGISEHDPRYGETQITWSA